MKNTKGQKKQNIFIRILKSPATALLKVTNVYMNGMSSCAGRFGENTVVVNCSIAPQVSSQLPRNFSVSSSKDSKHEDELKDLIRAVSTKMNESKIEIKNVEQIQKRSYSVGIGKIGRIDEDADCDFKEEVTHVNLIPRCKSYAVPSNRIYVRT